MQQQLAPGQRTLDIDTLADEVAWWARQVACDPRISPEAKTEITASFAAGLALARVTVLPNGEARARGGVVGCGLRYLVGEQVAESPYRIDPGADERARRAVIMGIGGSER